MKLKWIAILGIIFMASQASAAEKQVFKNDQAKQSYSIGVDLAKNLKRQGVPYDADALAQGFRDELKGSKLLLSDEDLRAALNGFHTELKQRRAKAIAAVAEENKKQGEAFLTANKTKEGVVALPSGLQYKILKAGEGRKPTDSDTVEVNYQGTLIDGTEFDNSSERGGPAAMKVDSVIPGWTEALKLMPVGSKWQLFIPPQLAYGEKGAGNLIGPNATLVFEVEVLSIK